MPRAGALKIGLVLVSIAAISAAIVLTGLAALADETRAPASQSTKAREKPASGYVPALPDAPATIHGPTSDGLYVYEATQVRNVSEARITGLRFAALLPGARAEDPVRVILSPLIPTALAPGEAASLRLDLLPIDSLTGDSTYRRQPMLAVVGARFADGDSWALEVDRQARTVQDALYLEPASVAPALVGAPPRPTARGDECLDHRGRGYSRGAVVPILGSGGDQAVCENGTWQPVAATQPTGRR